MERVAEMRPVLLWESRTTTEGRFEMPKSPEEMDALQKKFDALCAEYRKAQNDYFRQFAPVSKQMRAVADGGSTNPTEVQIDAMNAAWARAEELKKQMDAVIQEAFGPGPQITFIG